VLLIWILGEKLDDQGTVLCADRIQLTEVSRPRICSQQSQLLMSGRETNHTGGVNMEPEAHSITHTTTMRSMYESTHKTIQ
jgi:hypothetical protein